MLPLVAPLRAGLGSKLDLRELVSETDEGWGGCIGIIGIAIPRAKAGVLVLAVLTFAVFLGFTVTFGVAAGIAAGDAAGVAVGVVAAVAAGVDAAVDFPLCVGESGGLWRVAAAAAAVESRNLRGVVGEWATSRADSGREKDLDSDNAEVFRRLCIELACLGTCSGR
jgi:hypothetical protein